MARLVDGFVDTHTSDTVAYHLSKLSFAIRRRLCHAVAVNRIMQAGIEHRNEGYYMYGYYINLTNVMDSGENSPANAVRRDYIGFASDAGGRLVDCGCPISNGTVGELQATTGMAAASGGVASMFHAPVVGIAALIIMCL